MVRRLQFLIRSKLVISPTDKSDWRHAYLSSSCHSLAMFGIRRENPNWLHLFKPLISPSSWILYSLPFNIQHSTAATTSHETYLSEAPSFQDQSERLVSFTEVDLNNLAKLFLDIIKHTILFTQATHSQARLNSRYVESLPLYSNIDTLFL